MTDIRDEEWRSLSDAGKVQHLLRMVWDDMLDILAIPVDQATDQELAAKLEVIRLLSGFQNSKSSFL